MDGSLNNNTVVTYGDNTDIVDYGRVGSRSLRLNNSVDVGSYLVVQNDTDLSLDGDFTIEAWVMLTDDVSQNQFDLYEQHEIIASQKFADCSAGDNDGTFTLRRVPSGVVTISAYDCSSGKTSVLATPDDAVTGHYVQYNTWHHIAWVRSNSLNYIFVQGSLWHTFSYEGILNMNDGLKLGRGHSDHTWFAGNIDELMVSRHARYANEFEPITACGFAEQLANGGVCATDSTGSSSTTGALNKTVRGLEDTVDDVLQQIDVINSTIDGLLQNDTALQSQIDEYRADIVGLQNNTSDLQSMVNDQARTITELTSNVSSLSGAVESMMEGSSFDSSKSNVSEAPAGTMLWNYSVPTDNCGFKVISSAAISKNGLIFSGSTCGQVYCWDTDGRLRWLYDTFDSEAALLGGAVSPDGSVLIVPEWRGTRLLAITTTNGSLVWEYHAQSQWESHGVAYSPDGSTAYIVDDRTGGLYALNVSDGSLTWNYDSSLSCSTNGAAATVLCILQQNVRVERSG
mgnify:CR=1 FL=1